ncbi:hypothetical protein HHK36_027370 [Tetracentron sinense]|uniref:Late embryogenesis abundant protein LEA-2 subgroup domain-containing protein n=1 Tax=Tetracentron sinense TaxID=13715 RepID=A0A834YJ11_TETSI|nr:hypothetical protein HHK36_027370 [Tetracentron sinense]
MTQDKSTDKAMASRYAPNAACRFICGFIVVFLLLAGVTALIVWLVYRPHNPQFTVIGAAIYDLNTTSPPIISTTMQFTVVTRNPNSRVSIYYDRLSAFVLYRNQQITPPAMLPPLFHEEHSTVAMSPILGGMFVPVANGLVVDEAYGVLGLRCLCLVLLIATLIYELLFCLPGHVFSASLLPYLASAAITAIDNSTGFMKNDADDLLEIIADRVSVEGRLFLVASKRSIIHTGVAGWFKLLTTQCSGLEFKSVP